MKKPRNNVFERFSHRVTLWTGSTWAFITALSVILAWAATGPIFHYSDTWQLVINTSTTIITFLMVFLIQRAQNKDSKAVSLKLNEIVAALEGASNRLIDVEDLSEHDLDVLHRHYAELVHMARRDLVLTKSHSVEEAQVRHAHKLRHSKKLDAIKAELLK
ncbi:MAG TPA: low affinity iron permease family protein [Polyangiaceae bacterium]|jgi:low affinity Fe/Cu permease|nr:low affinity iron permease family protein [Polyangiaceae bacterium]